jgi:antitoxin (DNA-binding transcriptional repressor) of toxin-antitoxin stability system
MHTKTIQAMDARQRLGELLELVYYKGKRFRIARKNKPMAWIVGEPFMKAVGQAIDHIIEHEPAVADSLAITFDDEIRNLIEKGSKEIKEKKIVPIESIIE